MVVISGPSGVGKDMAIARLKEMGQSFHFVVTATTRPQRPNERDGTDYIFISMTEFAEMIEAGELLEYAVVYGDYKGIPKGQVRRALASGKDVIMRIDVQGAQTIRRLVPEAVFIYLSAESEEALVKRLRERKTEPEEQLKMRIATARQELKRLELFDYVVINAYNRLDETCQKIIAIITAERCRVHQREIKL
jgi:guanylate kinase